MNSCLQKLFSTSFLFVISIYSMSVSAATCGTANTVIGFGETCTDISMYTGAGISINNAGTITNSSNAAAILVNANNIDSLVNSGVITGAGNAGVGNYSGIHMFGVSTITLLENSGAIIGRHNDNSFPFGSFGINMDNNTFITTLTNTGFIQSGSVNLAAIYNAGRITTLNNAQGGNSSNAYTTALTLSCQYFPNFGWDGLPINYNIIIQSATHYGQLDVSLLSAPFSPMNFGIYAGSSITSRLYTGVLQGLTTANVGSTRTGTYDGMTWTLAISSGTSWDLTFTGASTIATQSSLHSLAPKLRSVFSGQSIATNFANMNTYDCDLFDAKGVCVSVGGQQTYVDNPSSNMTSTVVVAGYKVSPNVRIGGFLNQNINNNTVAGVHISNANPLMGLFAVWNQKDDSLGYQVKIANAYQDKDVTTTRDVFGLSEAGTGKTNLNTQSYVGEISYAFLANEDKTLVRPYAALRYTRIKQDGYTEQTSAGVTAPLTYSALADRSTTALLGVKLNHKIAEKVNLTGSLGIEQDLNHQVDNLTATGVSSLTSENFNDSIKRTRPVASIGAYYMPVKNQRIAADLYYQQLPFQSTGSATAYVNYTIGF